MSNLRSWPMGTSGAAGNFAGGRFFAPPPVGRRPARPDPRRSRARPRRAGHSGTAPGLLYQTVGYGREPLFDYLLAAWQGAAGVSGLALRLLPAYLSLLMLSVTFRWVRSAFGRPVALLTVALLAVSFWPLATGRQLLRSGLLPLLFTGAALGFWRLLGDKRPRAGSLLLFVLCLAAAIYTYLPARVLWLVFPLALVPLWLADRERALGGLRVRWRWGCWRRAAW